MVTISFIFYSSSTVLNSILFFQPKFFNIIPIFNKLMTSLPIFSTRNALIEEEYAEYNQEPVDIEIEQQLLETNSEDPFNHIP